MLNAGLDEYQDETKIARRNINNLRYADDATLKAEGEEELKSLFLFFFFHQFGGNKSLLVRVKRRVKKLA